MRKGPFIAAAAFLAGVLVGPALTGPAHSQKPPAEEGLAQRVGKKANVTEEQAAGVIKELGPAVRDDLSRGKEVSLPGLGSFRVVRVPEHRDLQQGRVVTVPATNYVEFLPAGDLQNAANSKDARPAEVVPVIEYDPIRTQTPGQKNPGTRMPPVRTKG